MPWRRMGYSKNSLAKGVIIIGRLAATISLFVSVENIVATCLLKNYVILNTYDSIPMTTLGHLFHYKKAF